MVSKRLEISAPVVVLLAVVSLCGALWIYTHVQTTAQARLAEAFRTAEFEGPFCDAQVSLDGTRCRKSPRMSWQQIHAVLAAARVIDVIEYESCSTLEARFNGGQTEGLEDLLKTLRGDSKEPAAPECPGGVDNSVESDDADESAESGDADQSPEGEEGEKSPPGEDAESDVQPEVKGGEVGTKTALGLIVRLAKRQCEGRKTNDGNGSQAGRSHLDRLQRLRSDLSLALADALGESALDLIVRLAKRQCEGGKTNDGNGSQAGRSHLDRLKRHWSDLSRALKKELGEDGVLEWVFGYRCKAARNSLKEIGSGELRETEPSGWKFSTTRCLSDALVLGRLVNQHKTIGREDGELAGYNVTGCGQGAGKSSEELLDRFESFTTLMKYVLGRVHAEPGVRDARKFANLVRGPEHVGILTVALLITSLVLLRWTVFECRYAWAWRNSLDENAQAFRGLAMTLANGGDAAEREHEALSRGRLRVQWGLATIPAIGFVGTVRGILEALSRAGDVVWAADRLERADAIAGLAGELGLAFSTTLFALLAGIAVGLLVTVARVREGRGLDRLADRMKEGPR